MNTSKKFEMIYKSISRSDNMMSVSSLCKLANVSRSGYYNWVNNEESRKEKELQDKKDYEIISEAYNFRGYDKGVNGIYMRLLHMGITDEQKENPQTNAQIRTCLPDKKCKSIQENGKSIEDK